MKKLINSSILVIALAIISVSTSCKKDDVGTSLKLTIQNEQGVVVSGALVSVYASESDWQNETNAIVSNKTTGSDGTVTIAELDAKKYYYDVKKGTINNWTGSQTTVDALKDGKLNTLTIQIKQNNFGMFCSAVGTTWSFTSIFINGEDVTSDYDNMSNTFKKNLTYHASDNSTGTYTISQSYLTFDGDDQYKIISMTENTLVVQKQDGGDNYILTLNKR